MSTILLTGAGGAAIPDLIRHLKGLGHRVLTCDMDPQAPGLFLGDGGFVVPAGTVPDFGSAFFSLCGRQDVDVAIPLVDEELRMVSLVGGTLRCAMLVPDTRFIETCLDKFILMGALDDQDLPIPPTFMVNDLEADRPVVVKPRRGRGSRGVSYFPSFWASDAPLDTWVTQEYIDGPEYTVSVVCDQANVVHAVVPKRIIRKEGATSLAVTERNAKIDALCRRIAEVFTPCGPFNVQLRLRDGEPYVFEINPRFSGTVNLTIAAGCDEVGGLIELALGRPYTFGDWREGVVLVRQTHDGIMTLDEFEGKIPRRWDDGVGTSGR